jgi:hypothetical protein
MCCHTTYYKGSCQKIKENATITLMITGEEKKEFLAVLLHKGVADILPNKGFLEKELSSGRKLTIYAGFDPTVFNFVNCDIFKTSVTLLFS